MQCLGLAHSGSNCSYNKKLAITTVLINFSKVYVHIAYLALTTVAFKQTSKTNGKLVIFVV